MINKLLDDDTFWQIALQINEPFILSSMVTYLLALKDFCSCNDYYKRLLADMLMLVTIISVVVGLGRYLSNNSFFFKDAKTQREIDILEKITSIVPTN